MDDENDEDDEDDEDGGEDDKSSQCPGDKNDYATYHKRVPYVGNYEIIMIIMIRMILTTTDKNDDITS